MYRRPCFIGVRPVGIGLIPIIEEGEMFLLAKWSLFSRWFGGGGSGIFWISGDGCVCIGLVELQKLIDYNNIVMVSYFLEVFVFE